jgi:hypothetical protein
VARQSVAVAAAAPSPRTTAWGDGVGRLHAVGAEQWRPSRRALACHQEARGLAKGGREDGKAVRGSGSSVWRGRRGQSQPRRVANQAASPPPTPDVPTTARGSGPCGLRPKILRMCDRDSPCGPMGGALRPLGLIPLTIGRHSFAERPKTRGPRAPRTAPLHIRSASMGNHRLGRTRDHKALLREAGRPSRPLGFIP